MTGSPSGHMITVLLVDDDEVVTAALRRVLDSTADIWVVGVARAAAEALDALIQHRPDVVLMDVVLPDASGAAAATAIKSVAPRTVVVMLTDNDDQGALNAALAAGCAGYVEKTGPLDRLPAAVRTAAAGAVAISPEQLARLAHDTAAAPARGVVLTTREIDLLQMLATGLTAEAMAEQLTVDTVWIDIQSVIEKLGARSRLEAVVIARRHGLLREP